MAMEARDRLIVALDVSSVDEAQAVMRRLGDSVTFYKIGYQLAFAGGLSFAQVLIGAGKQVFVDLKLHDIGNTVAQGVKSVARLGATFLTVHAYPETMKAAVDAREGKLRILAVTVLTSHDDANLRDAGYDTTVTALVARPRRPGTCNRRRRTCLLGRRGSGLSRAIVGSKLSLITPGIRPAGSAANEQKRIMTPAAAIAAGADYLVVGRPVIGAADPKAAADAIVAEISQAKS